MRRPWVLVALAALPIVALDLLTKAWVRANLVHGEHREVWDGVLHLSHQRNSGVAFGLLSGLPDGVRLPLLLLIAVGGVIFLLVVLAPIEELPVRIATVLVLGGAVGNGIDRAVDGAVTDFIVLSFFPYVFNVADMAITLAGFILVVHMLVPQRGGAAAGEGAAT
jgi:signal peptidase II